MRLPARLAAVAALPLALAVASPAPCREISGNRSYAGEVVVPKGETWTVLPGAVLKFRGGKWTVRGTLRIEGTPSRPVRIEGDDSFEGLDVRGESGGEIRDAVLSGGSRGIQVTGGSLFLRRVRCERNGIGVEVGPHAKAAFDNCAFDAPSRVGVLVKRGGAAEVAGSRFSGAGKAGIYVYGADGVTVRDSLFASNAAGLQCAMPGAKPSVKGCVFRDNGTAVVAERMAEPTVDGCSFTGNRVALHFSRRAGGTVSASVISGNGDGVLVEFSSYPVFHGNRFRANRDAAVRLRNQSSRWEEEWGDAARDLPEGAPFGAAPRGRTGPRPPGGPAALPSGAGAGPVAPPAKKGALTGTVDFRGNDWGELGSEIDKGGAVAAIHDGRVEPDFEFRGKRYPMDRVLLR